MKQTNKQVNREKNILSTGSYCWLHFDLIFLIVPNMNLLALTLHHCTQIRK